MSIIKIENLGKQYRLGQVGTGTIKGDLKRWWYRVLGREDPFLRIGEANVRNTRGQSEFVWALRDISFDVQPGEVLGIIGKNGAGKSTLLKILSRVTGPTTGKVQMQGRVASLLEVGTGMHPDLTGRENIFLNGAILGMTKKEILAKFDEIVDFAGVERYIDTPVKRYSSGMHVRLGFAVAAHLEPEILIVDEVLAVGDAEFQKKCLGKMKSVSAMEGRTVLFVSHNMASIKNLCPKSMVLEKGELSFMGSTHEAIDYYLTAEVSGLQKKEIAFNHFDSDFRVEAFRINGESWNKIDLQNGAALQLEVHIELHRTIGFALEARFFNQDGVPLAFFSPGHHSGSVKSYSPGKHTFNFEIKLPAQMNRIDLATEFFFTVPGVTTFAASNPVILSWQGSCTDIGIVFDGNKAGWLLLN